MLSRPDADLVQRDPAIPGLSTLLDDDALVMTLQKACPEAEIRATTRFYTRYKPGMSCLAAYHLDIEDRSILVSARSYATQSRIKLDKVQHLPQAPGLFPSGYIILDDQGILLSIFPHDRKLRTLTRLEEASTRHRLLQRTLLEHPALWRGTVESLRYKPERRYVAALQVEGTPRAALKFYTEPEYERAYRNAHAFRARNGLRLPALLGYSHRCRLLAFEWIPGCVLSEIMGSAHLGQETVREVGRAFANLHAQSPVGLVPRPRERDLTMLRSLADGLAMLCPHLAPQARQLAERLIGYLAQEPPADDPIHGDCYAKQVLLTGKQVAIVDFDEAVRGDRRADLGLFIAHLERDVLRGTLPPDRVAPLRDSVLEGYVEVSREPVPAHLGIYTALGLFQLAHAPFRHCEPAWPDRMEAILSRVATLLPQPSAPRQAIVAHHNPMQAKPTPVAIHDPFRVTEDPQLSTLDQALDPTVMQGHLERVLRHGRGVSTPRIQAIHVLRYKPKRRCLIAYGLKTTDWSSAAENHTILGKIRARGLDDSTYQLHGALQQAGFDDLSLDGLSVPAPVGVIPALQMWLQRCVPGAPAIERLVSADGAAIAGRIAEAIHKLHRTSLPTHRQHTMQDELRILHDRLPTVTQRFPHWTRRLTRVLEACDRLGASVPTSPLCGIHRDFYHDQVLIDHDRLYLLDFDLFCRGNPGLDVGNFTGHLTEYSLRTWGDPVRLAEPEDALVSCFLKFAGQAFDAAVRAYTMLTLVRHIHLSTILPGRQACAEPLLELCEQRLDIGCSSSPTRRGC